MKYVYIALCLDVILGFVMSVIQTFNPILNFETSDIILVLAAIILIACIILAYLDGYYEHHRNTK